MGLMTTTKSKTVGPELAAVLPETGQPWYKNGGLLKLNFCILSIIMFCKNASSLILLTCVLIISRQPLQTVTTVP